MEQRSKDAACRSLRSAGLSKKNTLSILNQVESWVKSNGVEWTVTRLKKFKQAYIHRLAGQDELACKDLEWVSHTKEGIPKGPFSVIFKKNLPVQRALNVLTLYNVFLSDRLLPSQKEKFYSAVENPQPMSIELAVPEGISKGIERLGKGEEKFSSIRSFVGRDVKIPIFTDIKIKYLMLRKDTDNLFGFQLFSKINEGEKWTEVLSSRDSSYEGLVDTSGHPYLTNWMNSCDTSTLPHEYFQAFSKGVINPGSDNWEYVGKISHIQEPGLKDRVIAQPLLGFQLALSRLGNTCYSVLKQIGQDCTHDQDAGIRDIQKQMASEELVSLDLSNATDSFPLEFTLDVLRSAPKLFNPQDILLFEKVSKGKYFDPANPKGYTQWEKGQPLGLYPSFGAFALSHHVIAQMAITENGDDRPSSFYRILGDDIVITKSAASNLRRIYSSFGLSISENKSLDSPVLNEFGGRLITKDKLYVQPKWRSVSDRSFIDLARATGPSILGSLLPRQKRIVKILSEIPKDVSPYGMGWNPDGKTYKQRCEENKEVIDFLTSPSLQDVSSTTARALGDLEYQIRYRDSAEFKIPGENKTDQQLADPESRILFQCGITRVDRSDPLQLPDWTQTLLSISDPRGIDTLTHLETKLKDVLPQTHAKPIYRPDMHL